MAAFYVQLNNQPKLLEAEVISEEIHLDRTKTQKREWLVLKGKGMKESDTRIALAITTSPPICQIFAKTRPFEVLCGINRKIVHIKPESFLEIGIDPQLAKRAPLDDLHHLISRAYIYIDQALRDAGAGIFSLELGDWVHWRTFCKIVGVVERFFLHSFQQNKLQELVSRAAALKQGPEALKERARRTCPAFYPSDNYEHLHSVYGFSEFVVTELSSLASTPIAKTKLGKTDQGQWVLIRSYPLPEGQKAWERTASLWGKNGMLPCMGTFSFVEEKTVVLIHPVRSEKLSDIELIAQDISQLRKWVSQETKGQKFSAKDFGLKGPLYISKEGHLFWGRPGEKIMGGHYATVKMGVDEEEKPIVRRIQKKNLKEVKKMVRTLQQLKDCPAVIPLLGEVEYQNKKGVTKAVTFHPYAGDDLLSRLKGHISPQLHDTIALQLLQALEEIKGAHGDLKPDNICFSEDGILKLIDFGFYRPLGENRPHISGTLPWCSLEVLQAMRCVPEKLDVWPAGLILYFVYTQSPHLFYWQSIEDIKKVRSALQSCKDQVHINQRLDEANISPELRHLLKHMIVVDVDQRWDIFQSKDYFFKHVLPRPSAL